LQSPSRINEIRICLQDKIWYVSGTPINSSLSVGQKKFLLGFFSVNLKKALEESQSASSENNAVNVKRAVEFFIFGVATQGAVSTCN
jgi:hypothetical protein